MWPHPDRAEPRLGYTPAMRLISAHVVGGVIVLDEKIALPEGAAVTILTDAKDHNLLAAGDTAREQDSERADDQADDHEASRMEAALDGANGSLDDADEDDDHEEMVDEASVVKSLI